MNRHKKLIYAGSGILSTAMLAYLLVNLDWEVLRAGFAGLHWGWLALALLAYMLNVVLRAMRFSSLIHSRQTHWAELVPVSALHNILTYLLPAKTGDVSFIFIAKERLNLSLIEGGATLFAARFYDFSVVAAFLGVLLPLTREEIPEWIYLPAMIFCGLALAGGAGILMVVRRHKGGMDTVAATGGNRLQERVLFAWHKFLRGLWQIQREGAHGRVALFTVGIWLCIYINFYFATRSMGLPVAFFHIALISMVMIPLTLLPLQGFANLGTHEVGWTSVLVAFGYPYKTALAIAAGSHFVLLLSVLVSGGLAFLGGQALNQKK